MAQFVSKSLAARMLGIGRRTVQRYCKMEEPGLTQNGKVDWEALESLISAVKFLEGRRGWPLRKKRPQRRLPLRGGDKKGRAISHRTMEQRLGIIARELAIIAREIDAMTDEEQAQFFALCGGGATIPIRPAAFELHFRGYDEIACGYWGLKNWVPRAATAPWDAAKVRAVQNASRPLG